MADDFDVDSLAGDIAAWTGDDAGGDSAPGDAGDDRHPDDAAWSVKKKGEGTGEAAAEQSVEQAIEEAADAIFSDAPDPDVAWQREQRRLADEALRRAGVDPAQRHEAGISRREATRRLYRAEQRLREDPAGGLAQIASWYAPQDQAQRGEIAQHLLRSLGYESPGAISQHDMAELQHYRQQAATHQQALEAARPAAQRMLDDFRAQHSDFEQMRPTMSMLLQAGEARDLGSAYDMAKRLRGMPAGQEAAAKAEAERRRSEVAKAKAAGTPQTKSAPGRSEDPLAGKDLRSAQEAEYERIFGPGG